MGALDLKKAMRDALEAELDSALAEKLLDAAIVLSGRPAPASVEDAKEFAIGSLSAVVRTRLGPGADVRLRGRLLPVLDAAPAAREEVHEPGDDDDTDAFEGFDVDVDLDVDVEADSDSTLQTSEMKRIAAPVRVLIASRAESCAHALVEALGAYKVEPRTAIDEPTLRRAAFSEAPLLTVVDASAPPEAAAHPLVDALAALPDAVLLVVYAWQLPYGRELRAQLEDRQVEAVYVDTDEGIAPLADLIASRFARLESIYPK